MKRFEDLVAWQKAKELCKSIYRSFGSIKDYDFKVQIQKASVSIMNNIAEGFERKSKREFLYFLNIAKGSCGEVRSMVLLAYELGILSKPEHIELKLQAEDVSRIIAGLIKAIESKG